MDTPSIELVAKALRKIMAAVEGTKQKAVALGAIGRCAWGSGAAPGGVELLIGENAEAREQLLSAARGEGLQMVPGGSPLQLRYADAKIGGSAPVELREASTPLLRRVFERAQQGVSLRVPMLVATCEDLILISAASGTPADHDAIVDLLRHNAARIDGAYLKNEAQAAGSFDRVKTAWAAAKSQG